MVDWRSWTGAPSQKFDRPTTSQDSAGLYRALSLAWWEKFPWLIISFRVFIVFRMPLVSFDLNERRARTNQEASASAIKIIKTTVAQLNKKDMQSEWSTNEKNHK